MKNNAKNQRVINVARFGLDEASERLSYKAIHRLENARKAALRAAQTQTFIQTAVSSEASGQNALAMNGGPDDSKSNMPTWLSYLLPLIVLIVGLIGISQYHASMEAEELATQDELILTDDLPPQAYADHGFGVFMKNTRDSSEGDGFAR
jgi:hypothetical protein